MARFDLTDVQWLVIAPLLPNRVARVDDRRVLNGIFWRLRTGASWADIPERYEPRSLPSTLAEWSFRMDSPSTSIGLNIGKVAGTVVCLHITFVLFLGRDLLLAEDLVADTASGARRTQVIRSHFSRCSVSQTYNYIQSR